jgi:hypothetical protein
LASAEASRLLEAAESAQAACDLEVGLPVGLARALVEIFAEADLSAASPRALWNLLWLAADLTTHVDVYRAAELLAAVERLFERHFARALTQPGELSEAAEMAFDFFFGGRAHPLEALRLDEVLATLERVLALDNRFCRRAALHGLGHLRQRHGGPPARERIEALIDRFLDGCGDERLAAYARQARAGDVL